MAAFDSYDNLKTTLAGWVHRSDVTGTASGVGVDNAVDAWIDLFEAFANRKLRDKKTEKRASTSFSTEYVATPSDLLEAISTIVTDGTTRWPLEPMPQWVLDRSQITTTATARPEYVATVGAQFRLYPPPNATYSLDLTYYAGISPLSATNQSNWLLTEAPDAYLYGSLVNGAPYLRDAVSLPMWKGFRDEAMASVIDNDRQPAARLRNEYVSPPGRRNWNIYSDQ